MSDYKGRFVTSFHLFPEEGLKQPFEAEILGETPNHWIVRANRRQLHVLKAACSTVPYLKEELDTPEYKAKVEERIGKTLEPTEEVKEAKAEVAKPKAKPKTKTQSKAKPKSNDPFGGLLDF